MKQVTTHSFLNGTSCILGVKSQNMARKVARCFHTCWKAAAFAVPTLLGVRSSEFDANKNEEPSARCLMLSWSAPRKARKKKLHPMPLELQKVPELRVTGAT